jgi:hypothetical protein
LAYTRLPASLVLLSMGTGCAPSLSTFETARVPPKGHFAVAAGFEGSLPVGSILDAIDTGKDLGKKVENGQTLTSDEKWRVFDAGMQLLLSRLRWATTSWWFMCRWKGWRCPCATPDPPFVSARAISYWGARPAPST